jgi:hypothetical protein
MRNHPVKIGQRAARRRAPNTIDVMPRESERNAFANFRYSYAEISIGGGKAHVRSKSAQLEDGKLTTESFEGDVDTAVYERMFSYAQRSFAAQMALFLRPLELLLSFPPWRRTDRDQGP